MEERSIDRTELYMAEEAFLCGSAMEITAVLSIDGFLISQGQAGNMTKELHKVYLQTVRGEKLEYKNWLTPIY